ncbi:adhesion molecule [Volvox carteri f. nagariensis]|uniref:Adhesion molecule n=1 Tax=Volvox carteri f. nagariensis TaxID=3068 RepID=D8U1Y1_VOLCA|nr:adhesion molecule [Volvox carteri f. nagariensis]EFJ46263.1 adhesion molecule [Volvox carteri f. nagariensis]|eukprot:XP_002952710.1 adhesion molecule [Volvox carteri f. nagariensis]
MEATLCEFRAGKLRLQNGQLVPDTRKGLAKLIQTEDTLVHVQWYERTATGTVDVPEDDIIVFPGEATLEMIPGQRAAVLKFVDDRTRDMFFWFQVPQPEGDTALVASFNAALAGAHELGDASTGGNGGGGGGGNGSEWAVDGLAPTSAVEHAHVASEAGAGAMLGQGQSVGQLPTAPAQTPGSIAATNAQAGHLAAILGNAIAAGLGGGSRPAYGPEEQLAQSLLAQLAAVQGHNRRTAVAPGPSLAEVLRPETILPVLRDPAVLEVLGPHLPEEHRTPEALVALAHSPQFQQQLGSFSTALQTGQLDLSQFGLRATGYSVADFLSAIQDLVNRERQQNQNQAQGGGPAGAEGGQQPQAPGGSGAPGAGGDVGGGGGPAPMEQ